MGYQTKNYMKQISIKLLAALCVLFSLTACLKEDINNAIGTPSPLITLSDVIKLYKGSDVTLTTENLSQATKVTGIVISDAASQNISKGTVVVQNLQRGVVTGITLSFGENTSVPVVIGDSVVVEIAGGTLTRTNGSLVVKGLTLSDMTKVAENKVPSMQQVSAGELTNNFKKYEGALIRVVGADITPTPVSGETYAGSKTLNDGSGGSIKLFTESNATFANNRVPANATFTGIATYYVAPGTQDTVRQLRMRNLSDVQNASGPLYPGFPEDFETPDVSVKSSYNMANNNLNLKTGNWLLYQSILGNTAGRDRFNPAGKQCIRMQQNLSESAYVQMNFDLPFGASKVTIAYGAYYTDPKSTWKLEYSQDAGATWKQIGNNISDAPAGSKTATFLMNIDGPVRFRVNKLGLGTTNGTTILNGRLSIEDFAIYQN